MTKPIIVVCGPAKLGKSSEAFKAFQNSYAILTAENNSHYYKKLLGSKLKDNPKYRPPKRIKLIDTHTTGSTSIEYSWLKPGDAKSKRDENGNLLPVSQKAEFELIINTLVSTSLAAADKGEKPKYDNVIIDELGELLDRIFNQDILPNTFNEKGKLDSRGAYVEMGKWVDDIITKLRQLVGSGVGVCMTMHDREPDGDKMGGLKTVSANIGKSIGQKVDGIVRRVIRDPMLGELGHDGKPAKPRREWELAGSEKWAIGLRGIDEDDIEECRSKDLYEVLTTYAGFDM